MFRLLLRSSGHYEMTDLSGFGVFMCGFWMMGLDVVRDRF